ncbi:lytic transglycosylase domain-containing protein [Sphingomonas sp. AR_OL41]|nr:lytic transglycosylase domain-containing protein [Sphingomonas sp. AR_OL41]MDH7972470.1 lytic transglycosylase domain-containing protein [Sphingomonas sp. AR_OL41]
MAPASITAAAPVLRGATAADSVASYVAEAARRFSIPESWIYAVMRVESAGDPRAVSPKGATGLMQIMPDTWTGLRARYGLGGDIYDPHDNIMAGAAFLREMYDRYGAPGFLAAYNAGPGRYENHLATGRPLPAETITYVNRLAPIIGGTSADRAVFAAPDPRAWTRAALFAGRSDTPADHDADAVQAASEPPSVAPRSVDRAATRPVSVGLFIPLSGKIAR